MTKVKVIGWTILFLVFMLLNLGIFGRYNYYTAKFDILRNSPKLVVVGLPILAGEDSHTLTKKYGFQHSFYGCVVGNPVEMELIDAYNAEIEKHLNRINGEGWKEDYKGERDSLFKIKYSKLTTSNSQ
ncbi:hypothetical protein POV27_15845 [Aureisphaera galaxeae]|uniref:FEKKY domain-containing protein n=1 Tax=Aureisphaera galaxeae TaxID=1538023 RepID=UPI002350C786|nr:hypothetical protein [Aureisphaera galaxeae]MDC8005531.1 hypothetical protein [Aureisphaera galaxeae]